MYALYRELHPPTGVEHCLECHFFDLKQTSLVVASTSVLRVYNSAQSVEKEQKKKLLQVGEYKLYGNVQSLNKVRLDGAERESLLLAFSTAKLSVVEYDPENHDLKTVSLHYFEDDEEIKRGVLHTFQRPVVRVDPEGRCAVMLVYGTHLAVLPFRQEEGVLGDSHATASFLDDPQPTTPLLPGEEHSTILPSYTVDLLSLSEKVSNVKDIHFLHGYNSPTLFILYEPTPTWAGRITLRMDTHSMVAISLNTSEKRSPVIWHNKQLPFDACYTLPVPKPIGGVLVFGANTLIYMNQSSPAVGFSLNTMTETTTNFQLRQPPGHLAVSMDCSQATFVSKEQLVVALRGGEIYVLTLVPDGMRGLKNILFEKAAAGVLPSCVCCFGAGQVFIGSRLGNSMLLGYTKKRFMEEEKPPPVQKAKSEHSMDLDELEVYGDVLFAAPTLSSLKFEVFDSLLNIGPISNLTLAQPAFLSEEFLRHFDPDLELVTCSGHGKNGALCVLQRELRPQVVTTFELPGCSDMWTVVSETEGTEYDTYLLLSQADSTMVLQTGQEITELDSSGFATQAPTIYASNIAGKRYIIQVTGTDVRLLKGTQQLCRVALDMGGGVRSCDVTEPYVVVLLVDGTVALLQLQEQPTPSLKLSWPDLAKGSTKVTLISAYTDTSGMFETEAKGAGLVGVAPASLSPEMERKMSVDDEDELLYGDVDALAAKMSKSAKPEVGVAATPVETTPTQTNFCAVYHSDGSLEIYQVPGFKVVFGVRNFSSAPLTLKESGAVTSEHQRSSEASVSEILLTGLGPTHSLPHLLAMVDKDLVVYTAFPYHHQPPGHLRLRFRKVQHRVLISDRKGVKTVKQLSQQGAGQQKEEEEGGGVKFVAQLRKFCNIGGYSGVFVCGPYPHWLMVTQRGALNLHPMFIDGPITSFTSFHNVNCPHGFLYFSAEGELRISLLPSHLSYDAPWPTRKVPTHATPHAVSYHMESKTHVLVTSEQVPIKEVPKRDNPEELESIERDERFVRPMEDKFYMQLYAPAAWQPIPNTRYALERFERMVTMKVMKLRSQETMSGRKEFIVMGTTTVCGEAVQSKGRIRIFDVIEVIPEPGKPLTKHKLKCLYNEEQKGPISALEAVDGLLLACMAQRIFMWRFQDNKVLVGVAFIDTETYIHRAVALKNFILIADINRSILLLRYQEHLRTLSLISRDMWPSEVYACDYVIDGQQLGFIASDSDQNLVLYQYQPELPESSGGLYLTRRGDFNAGSHINTFFRVHCKSSAPLGASADVKALMADKRHVTFFATLDGGLGYVVPVVEKVYRRLLMLQTKLWSGLPHNAGLNPKAFRMFHSRQQYLHAPQRNILDGDLLMTYPQLSLKQRTDFAKQIGTSPAQILDDLKELDKITTHF